MNYLTKIISLFILILFLSACVDDFEPESSTYLDPEFEPDTLVVKFNSLENLDYSDCFYENNFLTINLSNEEQLISSISWEDGSNVLVKTFSEPTITFAEVITQIGDTLLLEFELSNCPVAMFIPNSFTPNNDGVNDTWGPTGLGVEYVNVLILDPAENILFETNDLNTKWDGQYDGELVPTGSYQYQITGRFFNGEIFTYSGWVELFL